MGRRGSRSTRRCRHHLPFPAAIVAAEPWELPPQARPQPPAEGAAPTPARAVHRLGGSAATTPVTERRIALGNADVRIDFDRATGEASRCHPARSVTSVPTSRRARRPSRPPAPRCRRRLRRPRRHPLGARRRQPAAAVRHRGGRPHRPAARYLSRHGQHLEPPYYERPARPTGAAGGGHRRRGAHQAPCMTKSPGLSASSPASLRRRRLGRRACTRSASHPTCEPITRTRAPAAAAHQVFEGRNFVRLQLRAAQGGLPPARHRCRTSTPTWIPTVMFYYDNDFTDSHKASASASGAGIAARHPGGHPPDPRPALAQHRRRLPRRLAVAMIDRVRPLRARQQAASPGDRTRAPDLGEAPARRAPGWTVRPRPASASARCPTACSASVAARPPSRSRSRSRCSTLPRSPEGSQPASRRWWASSAALRSTR